MRAPSPNSGAMIWSRISGVVRRVTGQPPVQRRQLPLVTQLRQGAPENPVYFIGMGPWERELAELICSDKSIFAIEVPWPSAWRSAAIKYRRKALPTMKELVAPYVSALTASTDFSSCIVAGFSFEGVMAFEAAHQINRRGGKVKAVILLDSRAQYPPPWVMVCAKLKHVWKRRAKLAPTDGNVQTTVRDARFLSTIEWVFVGSVKRIWRYLNAAWGEPGSLTVVHDDLGRSLPWVLIDRIYMNAAKNYSLQCLDSRGVLFCADQSDDPLGALDGSLGWSNLFGGGLEIVQMTGGHLMMVQAPHNRALSREMSKALDLVDEPSLAKVEKDTPM
jgi:thioesterase domain-containing protein